MTSPTVDLRAVVRQIVQEELAAMLGREPSTATDEALTPRKSPRAESYEFARPFVAECCTEDPAAETLVSDLYGRYVRWCHEHGMTPRPSRGLSIAFGRLGFSYGRIGNSSGRRGLRVS